MDWLAATAARRTDPQVLWPEARSVIMLGLNYGPDRDPLAILQQRDRGAISVYAQGDDYHELIKSRAQGARALAVANAGGDVKVFVDTAAVMEKPLAASAGLGWQGKHTNLVSREHGSWLFLGAIFTTLELAPDARRDRPLRLLPGLPRRLPDQCVSRALPARCAALHLVPDHRAQGADPARAPRAMGNRIYGCDDCLAVCPWNKFAQAGREAKLAAREALRAPKLAELARLDDAAFRALFCEIAGQAHRPRPLRAQCADRDRQFAAMRALAAEAERLLDDASPLVRGAAVWALAQLDPQRLRAAGARKRAREDARCARSGCAVA